MKHWRVDYSIRYVNGRIEEKEAMLEAMSITAASYKAFVNIVEPMHRESYVDAVVIWAIGIIEEDVF